MTNSSPKSMRKFLFIWAGQLISIVGSGLTGFGMSVWIFTQTGKATPLAMSALFYSLPQIIFSPLAGSAADRFNRRKILILSDSAAAIVTLGAAGLLFTDALQVWHIYIVNFLASVFSTFQTPAYQSSITMLVPKKNLARAGGIQQMGSAVQAILIPLLAGLLYATIGLRGVILLDFATYFFAVGALLLVNIPQPERLKTDEASTTRSSMWQDSLYGWHYLRKRPGLFGLLWYYAIVNFFLNFSGVLLGPMILSFATELEFGIAQMAGGAAMLLGGMLVSTWGGPEEKKIVSVIATIALSSTGYLIAGLRASLMFVAAGQFLILFFIPISAALSQAVWQIKVPPEKQGRVFAIRAMIAYSIIPLANLSAGPLADRVFVPLLLKEGALSNTRIAALLGTGPGRGIGLMFIASSFFLVIFSTVAYLNPRIRYLEREIPDAIPDERDKK